MTGWCESCTGYCVIRRGQQVLCDEVQADMIRVKRVWCMSEWSMVVKRSGGHGVASLTDRSSP